jgi:hypothetical protein
MAIVPLQATTRHLQDRVILDLKGSRLEDSLMLYNISKSQATYLLTHTTFLITDTQ